MEIILDDEEVKVDIVFEESDKGLFDFVVGGSEEKFEIFVVVFVDVINFLKLSEDDSELVLIEKFEVVDIEDIILLGFIWIYF